MGSRRWRGDEKSQGESWDGWRRAETEAPALADLRPSHWQVFPWLRREQTKKAHQMETITLTGGGSAGDCGAVAVIRGKKTKVTRRLLVCNRISQMEMNKSARVLCTEGQICQVDAFLFKTDLRTVTYPSVNRHWFLIRVMGAEGGGQSPFSLSPAFCPLPNTPTAGTHQDLLQTFRR